MRVLLRIVLLLFVILVSLKTAHTQTNGNFEIIVRDSSDYSFTFLNELQKSNIDRIIEGESKNKVVELIDDKMILGKVDTVGFSSYLPVGEKMKFFGKKDNIKMKLYVQRINYTSITYSIMIVNEDKEFYQDGIATIHPLFFLGAESNENDYTGVSYFVDEYISYTSESCYISIRIGEGDESDTHLGKIIMNCLSDIEDIKLVNSPTLIAY